MPTPDEYATVAHLMARGRNHRLRFQESCEEITDPDTEAVGAWVPIDVWISAAEVPGILAAEELRLAEAAGEQEDAPQTDTTPGA